MLWQTNPAQPEFTKSPSSGQLLCPTHSQTSRINETTVMLFYLQEHHKDILIRLLEWAPVSWTGSSSIMLVNENLWWIALYTAKLLRGSNAQWARDKGIIFIFDHIKVTGYICNNLLPSYCEYMESHLTVSLRYTLVRPLQDLSLEIKPFMTSSTPWRFITHSRLVQPHLTCDRMVHSIQNIGGKDTGLHPFRGLVQ